MSNQDEPTAHEDVSGSMPAYYSAAYNSWWEEKNGMPPGSVEVACRYHLGPENMEHILQMLLHNGIYVDPVTGVYIYPPESESEIEARRIFGENRLAKGRAFKRVRATGDPNEWKSRVKARINADAVNDYCDPPDAPSVPEPEFEQTEWPNFDEEDFVENDFARRNARRFSYQRTPPSSPPRSSPPSRPNPPRYVAPSYLAAQGFVRRGARRAHGASNNTGAQGVAGQSGIGRRGAIRSAVHPRRRSAEHPYPVDYLSGIPSSSVFRRSDLPSQRAVETPPPRMQTTPARQTGPYRWPFMGENRLSGSTLVGDDETVLESSEESEDADYSPTPTGARGLHRNNARRDPDSSERDRTVPVAPQGRRYSYSTTPPGSPTRRSRSSGGSSTAGPRNALRRSSRIAQGSRVTKRSR